MAAVVGILDKHNVEKKVLQNMQELLQHRGTANVDSNFFSLNSTREKRRCGGVVGSFYEDSNIIIAIDGAIYNAKELCAHLNIDFNESYEQLFVRLYQLYGFEKALQMVDGAFAICLVDLNKHVLYVARDRMGIKPIYYYHKRDMFLFASEYKAFYCHPQFKAELNEEAVSEYFIFRYPAGERTFLNDVYLIKPGTYLEITNNTISTHKYWRLPSPKKNALSFEENKLKLKEYIHKSVARRFVEDKPIGVQLSGGVDSSYVAAAMREQWKGEIKSYSIVMDNKTISEEEYIDVVNKQLHLVPHKLNLDAKVFLQNWEKTTWFYESPLQHEGNVPLVQLNNEASKEVSILFCGDGADESMGGYERFSRIGQYKELKRKLSWYKNQLVNFAKGRRYYKSFDEYFISLSQFLSDEEIKALRPKTYKDDLYKVLKKRKRIIKACHSSNTIHRYLEYEMVTYLLDTLLRGDKLSSAFNVEMRAPLLMHDLIEFLQGVPEKYLVDNTKSGNRNTKILLKSLCCDIYGEEFTYRNKVGLGIPMHEILNDEKVRSYVETRLLPKIKQREIINYDYLLSVWKQMPNINSNGDSRIQILWLAFSFEIWAQMYIDSTPIQVKYSRTI